jgi:RimJ/RimL family protein N-acetyltransferase
MFSKIKRAFRIRRHRIFILESPDDLIAISPKVNVDISAVTFENVEGAKDFRSDNVVSAFRGFLEDNCYGVYAWHELEVVGHLWAKVCRKRKCRVSGYMDIPQNEAMLIYGNVCQKHRGKRIFTAMLVDLCWRLFTEARVSRIIADPEIDNDASLRAFRTIGFKETGTGTYIQVGGHLIYSRFIPFHR